MGRLAEQISIDCPPSRLEDLLSHQPVDWITPLLRLAGDEGEAAGLAILGETGAADRRQSPRRREHRVEVRQAGRVDGNLRLTVVWQASDYRLLFGELVATIEIRLRDDHSVLSLEGRFTEPPHAPQAALAAVAGRRAAESAARSLLGHLRSAVETSVDAPA